MDGFVIFLSIILAALAWGIISGIPRELKSDD
jgi:hypothetical protein